MHALLLITFFIVLTWTFYFLCRHPEVEEKLLAEINEVLGDETISMSHMDKLTYVGLFKYLFLEIKGLF